MRNVFSNYIIFTLSFLSLYMLSKNTCANEPVAMVTDFNGRAAILSNQNEYKCEILSSLFEGDEIKLDDDSAITIVYFSSSKEYKFSDKTKININHDSPASDSMNGVEPKDLNINAKSKLSPPEKKYGQAAIVFRGAKKKPKIKLIDPVNTKIINSNIEFIWEPADKNTQYRFVLNDDSGKSLIKTLVTGTKFKLPNELKLNENIYYSWHVDARLSSGTVSSNSSNFIIASKDESERINRYRPKNNASFSSRLVFAMLLEQEGYINEAKKYWKTLAKERPGNRELDFRARQ